MVFIRLHLHISEQHKLKTKVAFLMLILLKYITLFLDEGLLRNEKQTNNNKNCFVGSRTGFGPWTKLELFILVLWHICLDCLGLYFLQLKCYCMLQAFTSHLLNLIKFYESRGCDLPIFLYNAYQILHRRRKFA